MDISRFIMYIQQVEEDKKKQAKIGERQNKKFRFSEHDGGQQKSDWDGGKWSKRKWGNSGFYGRLHRGYCDEGKDKRFTYGHPGHMIRNYPIGKVASGVNNVPVASSLAPTPKGLPFSSGTGQI
ncbi:uncharacterized protein LOC124896633 [Capsicum annuum]|uniref:uncharacterized protein LOC124896633 n=1 Tax=Capsicum annuum TaxID=4072 RepID=UPI001FB0C578|nr:uncharacterized protein LOC124896633 [Capsicum annuum]